MRRNGFRLPFASADFVFLAKGNQPNTELIRDVDPSALTPGGLIKVNEYLQVRSIPLFSWDHLDSSLTGIQS
jgi:hypothetical protein